MATVNIRQLRREISAKEARIIKPNVKRVMENKFKKEKISIIQDFNSHPITVELENGPNSDSRFVKTKKGGNLFSLLGFSSDDNPTANIREILEKEITKGRVIKQNTSGSKLRYLLQVRIPTLEDIKKRATPLAWTTRSFIDMIEKGVSNFKRYLFDEESVKKYSRSGTAIQIKNDIKSSNRRYKPSPYLSKILQNFKNKLSRFNEK